MSKKLKIEILEPCFVEGESYGLGDVIEIDENDASHMVGNGRARLAAKEAKVGRAPKAKEEK